MFPKENHAYVEDIYHAKQSSITMTPNKHNTNEYIVLIDTIDTIDIKDEDDEEEQHDATMTYLTDYIPPIYFGSLTIVGLYILFQLLKKNN